MPGPFGPIERDLGEAIAVVAAIYARTFKGACVMAWTRKDAAMELGARR